MLNGQMIAGAAMDGEMIAGASAMILAGAKMAGAAMNGEKMNGASAMILAGAMQMMTRTEMQSLLTSKRSNSLWKQYWASSQRKVPHGSYMHRWERYWRYM